VEGRHITAFPTVKLRKVIAEWSIFKQIRELGLHPRFANAFNAGYFAHRHTRFSVSTWSMLSGNIPFQTMDDLQRAEAVSHDLTNRFLNRLGFSVPVRRPSQSGKILSALISRFDFVFFEYMLTDMAGHHQDFHEAYYRLHQIREMMMTLLASVDLHQHTILLISDHGNLEDLSTNTHTRHFVPAILWGKDRESLAEKITQLEDITPAIVEYFHRCSDD